MEQKMRPTGCELCDGFYFGVIDLTTLLL